MATANYVLQTNGSGQIDWAENGNGDITGSGTAGTVTRFTGSGSGVKSIGDGPITFSGTGSVNSTFGGIINVNGTGDNTFIGNIKIDNAAPVLHINSSNNSSGFRINVTGLDANGDTLLRAQDSGTTKFTIRRDGFATFTNGATFTASGSVVTAPTFSGDLNGTINTATTAVTQINSVDNTTVATTAYVVNKIAELPAGLNFLGTWNASTNAPTLASGGGERSTGTTTTKTANKLIDSSATFTTAPAVVVGDRVRVVTPAGPEFALVTAVDSATQLTLAADIVTATGEAYILEVAPFLPEGSYYIVSDNGDEDLNGITDWKVGDWVVASSTNVWQKIDNSSVLSGSGTGGSFAGWTGSGTSVTLGNAPVTFSGNNSTFAGAVGVGVSAGSNAKLEVVATSGEVFRADSNGGAFRLVVNQTGVNTQGLLANTGPAEFIDTSNPGATSGSVIIEGRRDGSANLLTLRARDASAPTSALPNGQGGLIRFQGFDGTDFENMGYIQVAADGQAVADGDAPSFMAFGTSADGSSSPTEGMRIDSSRNATFAGEVTLSAETQYLNFKKASTG